MAMLITDTYYFARKKLDPKKLKRMVFSAIRNLFLVILGIFSASFGLEGFLMPNNFIDGGVTGISLLVAHITKQPLSILIFIINIPFIILAYRQISKWFAIKTFLAIIGLSIVLATVHFPIITKDKLLIAIFGGIFLGAGVGLSVRGGSVLDGTEILALYLSKKIETTIGDLILIFNVIIFLFAVFILGVEPALYSILTYMAASKTIDFIVEGIEEYTGITIVSDKSPKVKRALMTRLGRGITIYKGKKSIIGKTAEIEGISDQEILFTVVTKLEIGKVKRIVNDIDENAFIYYFPISNAKGGELKKRPLHG